MTYELKILLWASVWGIVQFLIATSLPAGQAGFLSWVKTNRDTSFDFQGIAARGKRAASNFQETFAFFVVAVFALVLTQKTNDFSIWGARLYLLGRILYLPCYLFGFALMRSLVWGVSFVGIILCYWTLLS